MFLLVFPLLMLFSCSNWTSAQDSQPVGPQIWSGKEVPEGKWPFMAEIRLNDSKTGHLCGASVLNDDTVITAAHCLLHKNKTHRKVYLYLGQTKTWDPVDKDSVYNTQGSYDEPVVATPHIWNGENANIAKWPFMASIRGNDSVQLHSCGAVVLNDDTAITAAHCLQGANGEDDKPRFLYLGQDTLDPVDNSSIYIPRKFIIHPQYVNESGDDISLIKLSRKIDFKSAKGRIGKICLPSPDTKPDGSKWLALGWGYAEPNKDTKGVLQQVKLPLVKCNSERSRILCAGYKDRPDGICFGDSGGPLVCPPKDKPNTYLLYGLSAILFDECGKAPGGFTEVAQFLKWIQENAEN